MSRILRCHGNIFAVHQALWGNTQVCREAFSIHISFCSVCHILFKNIIQIHKLLWSWGMMPDSFSEANFQILDIFNPLMSGMLSLWFKALWSLSHYCTARHCTVLYTVSSRSLHCTALPCPSPKLVGPEKGFSEIEFGRLASPVRSLHEIARPAV
jgi:hypothetical protein